MTHPLAQSIESGNSHVFEAVGLNPYCVLSKDGLFGRAVVHTNSDRSPVTLIWRGLEAPLGNWLYFHDLTFGDVDWEGVMNIMISVYQDGLPPQSRSATIDSRQKRLGIGFCLQRTTFSYEIDIRLASDHYDRSLLQIHSLQSDPPIPESTRRGRVFRLDGAKAGKSYQLHSSLVSANQGGLMNRIYPLLSTVCAAESVERSAFVYWAPNEHCSAEFSDLFDVTGEGFGEVDSNFLADSFGRHVGYESPGAPVPLTDLNMIVYSHSPFATEASAAPSVQSMSAVFKRLPLSKPVQAHIKRFDGVDFSRVIGFHVRRAYPGGAFSEIEQAKFGLSEEVFIDLLLQLRENFPEFTRAFVCTNDLETEARIKIALGDYVFTFDKSSVDNTSDSVAIQEALADLLLLSKCPVIFSQSTTAFGRFAHDLGDNTMFQMVTDKDLSGHTFYHWLGGAHVDTIDTNNGWSSMRDRLPRVPS